MLRLNHLSVLLLSIGASACFALSPSHIDQVSRLVADTLDSNHGDKYQRYESVREITTVLQAMGTPQNELVYGELSVAVLAELLDAVGVEEDDAFLDIGSGDGALVLGAAMLYPEQVRIARGLELVPGLLERSQVHAQQLHEKLQVPVEFSLGDVHCESDETVASILADSTLAVCFATTWSANNVSAGDKTSLNGRSLPKLSTALTRMPLGSRILLIDGRLSEKDGYRWEGDMKIACPDTAPFSIASLYERR
jgi:hypothetical protein